MRIIAIAVLWLIPKICSWVMNVVASQKRVECAGISLISIPTNHCIVDIIVACALLKTGTAVKSNSETTFGKGLISILLGALAM